MDKIVLPLDKSLSPLDLSFPFREEVEESPSGSEIWQFRVRLRAEKMPRIPGVLTWPMPFVQQS